MPTAAASISEYIEVLPLRQRFCHGFGPTPARHNHPESNPQGFEPSTFSPGTALVNALTSRGTMLVFHLEEPETDAVREGWQSWQPTALSPLAQLDVESTGRASGFDVRSTGLPQQPRPCVRRLSIRTRITFIGLTSVE